MQIQQELALSSPLGLWYTDSEDATMRRVGVHESRFGEGGASDIVTLFSRAREYEYNLLEIDGERLLSLSPLGRKRISLEARNYQLDLSYSLTLRHPFDLSAQSDEVRKQGISHVEQIIKSIGEMGGGSLNGTFYTVFPQQQHMIAYKDQLFEQSVNSLRTLAILAESEDVLLNIRPVNRYEHFFLNTSQDALQFVRAVNHPSCGIDLDTFHMNIEEESMEKAIEISGYYLHCFHIRENTGDALGRGSLDWNRIKQYLDAAHYEGTIVHAPDRLLGHDQIPPFEGKQIKAILS